MLLQLLFFPNVCLWNVDFWYRRGTNPHQNYSLLHISFENFAKGHIEVSVFPCPEPHERTALLSSPGRKMFKFMHRFSSKKFTSTTTFLNWTLFVRIEPIRPRLSYISKEQIWSNLLTESEASQIGGKLCDGRGQTSSMDWVQRLRKQNSPCAHRRVECKEEKSFPEKRLLYLYLTICHCACQIWNQTWLKNSCKMYEWRLHCCLEMRGLYNKPQITATCTSSHFSSLHN